MIGYSKQDQLTRPRQRQKADKGKEAELQRKCEEYLKLKRIPFIRVPDAVYKVIFANQHLPIHHRTLIASFIKGLPDLTIFRKADPYNIALCIELKSAKGKLTHHQKHWADQVTTVVVRSFDEFIRVVEEFEK